MKDIKGSVIIPVYKVPLEYLRDCLDSLKAQTMQECEFIIVSDGAPEAECSVCEEYAAKDSRFKFFKREHAGVSAARNYGIEQAHGEYISFVDSDDWVENDYTQFLSEHKNYADIIFFNFIYHYKGKVISKNFPNSFFAETGKIQESLLTLFDFQGKNDFLGYTCNKFFKKQIIDEYNIRFDASTSFFEDEIFAFQYCQHVKTILVNNRRLYNYRILENSLTNRKKNADQYYRASKGIFDALKEYNCQNLVSTVLNKRVIFLRFLSVIKQNTPINMTKFNDFYAFYFKYKKKTLTCKTLRFIFFFPKKIAYILCHLYKAICWLPGLKL